jgi:hypothetical protein
MSTLRDELRKAADKSRERPDWTKRRMPTLTWIDDTHVMVTPAMTSQETK